MNMIQLFWLGPAFHLGYNGQGRMVDTSFALVLDSKKGAPIVSAEEQKANDRRFFTEGLNRQNLTVYDELVATTVVGHTPAGTTQGLEAYKQFIAAYFTAFPDLQFTVEAQIAEGDQSVVHWTARGTHQGMLGPVPPTGKSATTPGITLSRWANGKVVESWIYWDNLALMQRLGVIPVN
jgi:steroid delta-isomerase-like uncharacterized protein